ncbi:MAG TPA: YetF domain-containing protein [Chitinophagaceae bacterium]|nr:YetF domain-containing protein [Chitinophagaceae bacterium]
MKWINFIIGQGPGINAGQMMVRAVIVFLLTLVMIRIAGLRTFGKKSAVDNVVLIILGAVMSRAVVGVSPFIPITAACFMLVIIHRLLAWLSVYSGFIGRLAKGERICLLKDGIIMEENLTKAMISHKDLMESVRLMTNEDGLGHVKDIYLERSGELSVIKKVGNI